MFLIVGLGNPGNQYQYTRHNLGFLFLDYFTTRNDFTPFKLNVKLKGELSTGQINGEKIILLKPTTFMNLSGQSIIATANFYKIPKENIIIIYDDISMDFGKIRVRHTGSAGGHNGIKSIIEHFGEDFTRIKYGIDYNEKFEVSDWVLSRFTKSELKELEESGYKKIETELLELLKRR